jgi:LysM repeat protein
LKELLSKKTAPKQKIIRTDKIVKSDDQEYIKHHVRLTDTISGLSLKYKVSAEKIKRLNKIQTDKELWTRPEIKIPIEGTIEIEINEEDNERIRDEMKRRLNNRFRRVTATRTEEEARYYLGNVTANYRKLIFVRNE